MDNSFPVFMALLFCVVVVGFLLFFYLLTTRAKDILIAYSNGDDLPPDYVVDWVEDWEYEGSEAFAFAEIPVPAEPPPGLLRGLISRREEK